MNKYLKSTSDVKKEYINFLKNFRSLELSTIGEKGNPETSYAPFVRDDKKNFYIYVSSLAKHTQNLINDRRAGVMLIESEEGSENIFSRKRAIFDCVVVVVIKNTEDWNKIMLKFDKSCGNLMQTLRMLPDFQLLCLQPKSGRFIKGFGMAYEISGEKMSELSHINLNKK